MKRKWILLFTVLTILGAAACSNPSETITTEEPAASPTPTVFPAYEKVVDGLIFRVENSKVTVIGVMNGNVKEISIPVSVDGICVTSIGEEAFYGCESLTNIEIPSSVTSIGRNVFYECDSLTSIIVTPGSYAESWAKRNGYSVTYK